MRLLAYITILAVFGSVKASAQAIDSDHFKKAAEAVSNAQDLRHVDNGEAIHGDTPKNDTPVGIQQLIQSNLFRAESLDEIRLVDGLAKAVWNYRQVLQNYKVENRNNNDFKKALYGPFDDIWQTLTRNPKIIASNTKLAALLKNGKVEDFQAELAVRLGLLNGCFGPTNTVVKGEVPPNPVKDCKSGTPYENNDSDFSLARASMENVMKGLASPTDGKAPEVDTKGSSAEEDPSRFAQQGPGGPGPGGPAPTAFPGNDPNNPYGLNPMQQAMQWAQMAMGFNQNPSYNSTRPEAPKGMPVLQVAAAALPTFLPPVDAAIAASTMALLSPQAWNDAAAARAAQRQTLFNETMQSMVNQRNSMLRLVTQTGLAQMAYITSARNGGSNRSALTVTRLNPLMQAMSRSVAGAIGNGPGPLITSNGAASNYGLGGAASVGSSVGGGTALGAAEASGGTGRVSAVGTPARRAFAATNRELASVPANTRNYLKVKHIKDRPDTM